MRARAIWVPVALGKSPSGLSKTGKQLRASSSRSMQREVCNRDLPNHRVVRTQSIPGLYRRAFAHPGWDLVLGPYSAGRPAGFSQRRFMLYELASIFEIKVQYIEERRKQALEVLPILLICR